MNPSLNDQLGIEFPLYAFTHCRDVVVAVSKAGGLGVLGAVGLTPAELEVELAWIDAHIDGKAYGVDLIVPATLAGRDAGNTGAFDIPAEHKAFVRNLLSSHNISADEFTDDVFARGTNLAENTRDEGAQRQLDVALAHPIKLLVNALGAPPDYMLEQARHKGIAVGALVGTPEQALRLAQLGVDVIIAAGGEAGGHCGDIATIVLVPQVCDIVARYGTPVLAAGGIVDGRQMAACMAMGAAGAWTGSVWLTTTEAETSPAVKAKMLQATSRDTVRSKGRTGKYSRQLRSEWTDAWDSAGAPPPLPMPLQSSVTERALAKVAKLADGGHDGARRLTTYWVGQGVGMMNHSVSARSVVQDFMEQYLTAVERMAALAGD